MTVFDESTVEKMVLKWLADLDWKIIHGSDIAPNADNAEYNR